MVSWMIEALFTLQTALEPPSTIPWGDVLTSSLFGAIGVLYWRNVRMADQARNDAITSTRAVEQSAAALRELAKAVDQLTQHLDRERQTRGANG